MQKRRIWIFWECNVAWFLIFSHILFSLCGWYTECIDKSVSYSASASFLSLHLHSRRKYINRLIVYVLVAKEIFINSRVLEINLALSKPGLGERAETRARHPLAISSGSGHSAPTNTYLRDLRKMTKFTLNI
jgi:hypothetical protein